MTVELVGLDGFQEVSCWKDSAISSWSETKLKEHDHDHSAESRTINRKKDPEPKQKILCVPQREGQRTIL